MLHTDLGIMEACWNTFICKMKVEDMHESGAYMYWYQTEYMFVIYRVISDLID